MTQYTALSLCKHTAAVALAVSAAIKSSAHLLFPKQTGQSLSGQVHPWADQVHFGRSIKMPAVIMHRLHMYHQTRQVSLSTGVPIVLATRLLPTVSTSRQNACLFYWSGGVPSMVGAPVAPARKLKARVVFFVLVLAALGLGGKVQDDGLYKDNPR